MSFDPRDYNGEQRRISKDLLRSLGDLPFFVFSSNASIKCLICDQTFQGVADEVYNQIKLHREACFMACNHDYIPQGEYMMCTKCGTCVPPELAGIVDEAQLAKVKAQLNAPKTNSSVVIKTNAYNYNDYINDYNFSSAPILPPPPPLTVPAAVQRFSYEEQSRLLAKAREQARKELEAELEASKKKLADSFEKHKIESTRIIRFED